MRITGDHTTALSFIGHGHGQQRGMPLIAQQGETFRQSYFETVVGILGKLVGWIADRCQSLDVTHDDDDLLRVHSPVIATGPLCVCWQGSDSPTTCRSIVWDENTLAEQCRERPVPVPSGSSGFFVFWVFSFASAVADLCIGIVFFAGLFLRPDERHWRTPIVPW